jgi:hypothetical protein
VSVIERLVDLLLGLFAGTYGTLIGAGGGFIMSPILLLFFGKAQQVASATSLMAVCFNAAMAVYTYHQHGRIDYYTGIRFALATIPGALLGSILVNYLPGPLFKLIFGIVLILVAGYMAIRGERPSGRPGGLLADEASLRAEGKTVRVMIDRAGNKTVFGYRMRDGLLLSSMVGVLSSLLGVGGGIIHTPMMIGLFGIPPHIAVATSQFILLISAITGTSSYLAQGLIDIPTAIALGLGGIVGARLGATIARRIKGKLIVRLLAVALLLVGGRLIWGGLGL